MNGEERVRSKVELLGEALPLNPRPTKSEELLIHVRSPAQAAQGGREQPIRAHTYTHARGGSYNKFYT